MIRLVVLALLCVGLGLADPIEKDYHADKTAENSDPPEITFQMIADPESNSNSIEPVDEVLSKYAQEENSEPPEFTFQMVADLESNRDSMESADEVLSEYAQEQRDELNMEDKDEDSSIDKRMSQYISLPCKQGGKTYQSGEEWGCLLGDGKPSCSCYDGRISCAQINCILPHGCKTDPNSKQCCPECINTIQELTSCKQGDKIYKDGEGWGCLLEEGNPRCHCYNGQISCAIIDYFCPNEFKWDPNSKSCYPECINTIQEESSCKQGDKTYKHGEGYGCLLEDGKPSCHCSRGHFVCADIRCIIPKGCKRDPNSKQCCPKCIDKVDGGLSEWSRWSRCSEKCGKGGIRSRRKLCNSPPPKNGGKYCTGHNSEWQWCNRKPCGQSECKTTKGVECVFPFTYKGKTWNRCTKAGSLWRWCKTANHWGYCNKKQCKRTRYEG